MNRTLRAVDTMCAAHGVTRADVLCALVRAFIERPASAPVPTQRPERKAETPDARVARAEAGIRKVMRRRLSCTVRELKAATNSRRFGVGDWGNAFAALCKAGELRLGEELTDAGRTRKVVTLLDGAAL